MHVITEYLGESGWMRFKPLISTWNRDGQAYEPMTLKHST